MKCPYCGKEMKEGYIQASSLLAWTPKNETPVGVTRWAKSPNSVTLAKWYGITDASIDACYCESCNKVIIDVKKD